MAPTNRSLALPYLLPFAIYVGLASLPDGWLAREWDYALRLVLTTAALIWGWRRGYVPLRGPRAPLGSVATGLLVGVVGLAFWIPLTGWLAPGPAATWTTAAWTLRLVAAALLVPLFEEQLMRGYVLRLAVQWGEAKRAGAADPFGEALEKRSIHDVAPGAATVAAVLASAIVFACGHALHEMPAALIYGLLMCGLWIVRRDLLACVVAHAATNLGLALWVRQTGAWELW